MRERLLIWATAVAALVPFYPLALPGDAVSPFFEWSDYESLQLPIHEFIRDEWRAGRVPLWIPWAGCGTPLHASQQAGVFYPGLALPLALFTANYALKLCLLAHLALAYAGQYRLCRALGSGAAGASFAALPRLGAWRLRLRPASRRALARSSRLTRAHPPRSDRRPRPRLHLHRRTNPIATQFSS